MWWIGVGLSGCALGPPAPQRPALPLPAGVLARMEPYSSYGLRHDGGWLYWWDRTTPASIHRVRASGGAPQRVATLPGTVGPSFTVQGDRLYASVGPEVFRVDLSEPIADPVRIALPPGARPDPGGVPDPAPLLLDQGTLYLCTIDRIWALEPDGGARELARLDPLPVGGSRSEGPATPCGLVSFARAPSGPLLLHNGSTYPVSGLGPGLGDALAQAEWVGEDASHRYQRDVSGLSRVALAPDAPADAEPLDLDDSLGFGFVVGPEHLYWIRPSLTDWGTQARQVEPGLVRLSKAGGAPQRVLALEDPSAIALADGALCWLERAHGALGCTPEASLTPLP